MFKKIAVTLFILIIIQGCGATQYKKKVYSNYKQYEKESSIKVSDRKNTKYYRGDIKYSMFDSQIVMVIREDKRLKLDELVESNIAYNKQKAEEEAKKKVEVTTKSAVGIEEVITTQGSITTSEGALTTAQDNRDEEEVDAFKKRKKKVVLKEIYKIYMGIKHRGREWIYINGVKIKDINSEKEVEILFGKAVSENVILEDGVTFTGGVYETAFFTITREEAEKVYDILKADKIEITLSSMYDGRKIKRKMMDKEKKEIINTFDFFQKIDLAEKERIKKGIADKEKADIEKEEKDKIEKDKIEKEKEESNKNLESKEKKSNEKSENNESGSSEEVKK